MAQPADNARAAFAWALQPYWGLALALLAALEGRLHAAVALLGYADEGFRRRGERSEPNEAQARARAEGLAVAALGAEEATAITRRGALLNDEQAGRLALAQEDGNGALT